MTLYATIFSLGHPGVEPQYVELTPDVIGDFLQNAVVFEKIGFSPQVIADLVVKYPTAEERTKELMASYQLTESQATLAQVIPLQEIPLYFDKEEYPRQIERLKTLQRLLQEMQDVLDK